MPTDKAPWVKLSVKVNKVCIIWDFMCVNRRDLHMCVCECCCAENAAEGSRAASELPAALLLLVSGSHDARVGAFAALLLTSRLTAAAESREELHSSGSGTLISCITASQPQVLAKNAPP